MNTIRTCILGALWLLALTAASQASPIKLQFQFNGSSYASAQSPGLQNGDFLSSDTYWNPIIARPGLYTGLKMTDGVTPATSVTGQGGVDTAGFGWEFDYTFADTFSGSNSPQSFYQTALMQNALYRTDDIAFRINGLPDGTYKVYSINVFPGTLTNTVGVSIGADLNAPLSSPTNEGPATGQTSWVAGDNYVEQTVTISSPTDYITIIASGALDPINGVQIVEEVAPEPATLGLVGLGGVLLLRRRRV